MASDGEDLGEDIVKLRDHEEEEEEEPPVVGLRQPRRRSQQPIWIGPRHPTLDDGFFGIDKFNRDTELMEAKHKSRGRLGGDDDDEEEEEAINLFAPIDGGEDEEDEEMELDEDEDEDEEDEESDEDEDEDEGGIPAKQTMLNGAFKTEGMEGIMYGDFFRPPYKFADSAPSQPSSGPPPAPPSLKAKGKGKANVSVRFHEQVRVKTIKARGKGKSLNDDDDEEDDFDALGMGMNGAGGAFMNPFMNMGPGGFGGFAPRQPVIAPPEEQGNQNGPNLNGANPFAGIDGMDREEDEEDYEEEDHEDEMEDDDEEYDEEDDEEDDDDDEDVEDEEVDYDMDEGQEAIERLKDDIFAEPEEGYRAPEELSTHEKRLRALTQEISILEDQNVAEKPWTQMGEANAKRRPENSLLETDLEFEASAKPAPIITEEVTQSLEDMIKARILENRFDDVIRQRPVDDKAFLPSKVLEISDKEAQKSLAEIYEDEYTTAASGEGRKDDRLAQEHKEIEKSWGDICYKLDALCNAHFTPKQPKATISTLSNVASASLESALPASVSTSTILAPEEMFAFDPRATTSKTEMSPGEKKALRTKVKHERKAQGQMINGAVVKFSNNAGGSATAAAGLKNGKQPKNAKEAKDAALESLVKTGKGVTVVGKPHVGKSTNVKDKAREGGASLKL
ncbi:hypothetical protein M407DRAFT_33900 [Tulasnella calospora MUT 4182]|uniref:U3 small nucleolar ribonucleoprotein protein MPP10 n=1 Tax=Tulasnella calospora MUT 4182 TaxID=1051891 RepID=A0A0C3Q276_9AGAM|nr:hypothetical protein M407DRAFT_33900 [Tulasnella calospora MUT 4182]